MSSVKNDKFTLAFFPNAKGFGFAFMQNALTLKDYQIVTSRPISNSTLMNRIRDYIDYYEPDIVILEDYNYKQSYKSKRVKKLIDTISEYAKTRKIKIVFYSREQIKFVFSEFNAKTKYEISKVISENIPKLKKLLKPKHKIWEPEPYAQGIFDAVSLGITHYFLAN